MIAVVLFLRGAGGLAVSGLVRFPTKEFMKWDLRLDSPLCLALAMASVVVAAW